MVFKGHYEDAFPDAPGIDFSKWMFCTVPVMLISTFLTWMFLQWFYMGMFRPNSEDAKSFHIGPDAEEMIRKVIETKYKELGPVNAHEKFVGLLFLLSVTLFFFRDPGFVTGWPKLLSNVKIGDATPAAFVVILFFVVPATWGCFNYCKKNPGV